AGNSHFWRNLALGLGALVVVVLVAKFPVARDDHGSSGALIVSGAGQAEPAPTEAGREPVAAVAPVATVQERNLEKAREQERELRAERQGGEELAAPREQEGHSGALELSGAAAAAVPASTPAAAQEPRGTSLSDLLTAPEIKSHTASESQEAGEAAAQESASQGSARDAGQRAEAPAAVAASPAPEAKPAQEEVPAIKSPTDVSRQVRIVNRQGLAALNSVEIRFKGAVALRITDHKGKILKDGTFKKGDHLKVSGIPPFTVSTSDGTLIGISYQGGEVVVPKRKQIRFALPTK
ncbi:MAG: DUF4115 domain-containing protein, partial [Succinivibrionaceae bacterium]|nr:DUF4115 domain-containing protein [Succinivibrionaceae bacterium]